MSQLSEEQQERVKQIRERQLEVAVFPDTGRVVPEIGTRFVVTGITRNVLDFHDGPCTVVELSLLDSDSQAAEGAYVCDKCGQSKEHTPECPSPAWCPGCGSRVIGHDWTACHNAATTMRDKCMDAIKSLRAVPRGLAYNNAISDAIHKVESLTLDQVKPEKQK